VIIAVLIRLKTRKTVLDIDWANSSVQ